MKPQGLVYEKVPRSHNIKQTSCKPDVKNVTFSPNKLFCLWWSLKLNILALHAYYLDHQKTAIPVFCAVWLSAVYAFYAVYAVFRELLFWRLGAGDWWKLMDHGNIKFRNTLKNPLWVIKSCLEYELKRKRHKIFSALVNNEISSNFEILLLFSRLALQNVVPDG